MTDSTPAPAAPSEGAPSGAPTATPAVTSTATPAETAAAGLETLAADKAWQADWSGAHGRAAQRAAVKLKSDVTRSAFTSEPVTASALPEKIQAGLDHPDPSVRAAAAAMRPGESPADYSFTWADASAIGIDALKNMNEIAADSAFSIGASPGAAKSVVAFIEKQLSANTSGAEITPEQLDTALAVKFGGDADAIATLAVEVVAKMPDAGKAWLTSALRGLDPSAAALVVGKLARVGAANAPKV